MSEQIEQLKTELKRGERNVFYLIKWLAISIFCGVSIGLIGCAFSFCMTVVTAFRECHPQIIWLLPFSGLAIVGLYRLLKDENDTGTNLILSSIQSGKEIPLRMAPAIFSSTVITHLFGGSAGREGAALQLGGSIGNALGRLFRLDEKDLHIITMCGMSAAFSALFGTPMAAAIFPMEVVSVGVMYYAALVPCVIASLTASGLAGMLGFHGESFPVGKLPSFAPKSACIIGLLAILCACVSILFCSCLHWAGYLYQQALKNAYLRVFAGGMIIALFTMLVGSQNYNGAGVNFIESFFRTGTVSPVAWLLKILFTALTLGAGFKGGEIVPTLYIGASFGCLFGMVTGFAPGLCTAVAMTAVFCGVTNSPITSLLISFELFGYDGMPYYLLGCSLSYLLSGYYGLYSSQKIMYSKIRTSFINRRAH